MHAPVTTRIQARSVGVAGPAAIRDLIARTTAALAEAGAVRVAHVETAARDPIDDLPLALYTRADHALARFLGGEPDPGFVPPGPRLLAPIAVQSLRAPREA